MVNLFFKKLLRGLFALDFERCLFLPQLVILLLNGFQLVLVLLLVSF